MEQGLPQERQIQFEDLFVLGTLPIVKQRDFWGPRTLEEEKLVSPEWLLLEESEALWEP